MLSRHGSGASMLSRHGSGGSVFALAGAQRTERLSSLVVRPMPRQGSGVLTSLPSANADAVKRCTEAVAALQRQVAANHEEQRRDMQVLRSRVAELGAKAVNGTGDGGTVRERSGATDPGGSGTGDTPRAEPSALLAGDALDRVLQKLDTLEAQLTLVSTTARSRGESAMGA